MIGALLRHRIDDLVASAAGAIYGASGDYGIDAGDHGSRVLLDCIARQHEIIAEMARQVAELEKRVQAMTISPELLDQIHDILGEGNPEVLA